MIADSTMGGSQDKEWSGNHSKGSHENTLC